VFDLAPFLEKPPYDLMCPCTSKLRFAPTEHSTVCAMSLEEMRVLDWLTSRLAS